MSQSKKWTTGAFGTMTTKQRKESRLILRGVFFDGVMRSPRRLRNLKRT